MPSSGGNKPGPALDSTEHASHVPDWLRRERAAGASTRKDEDTLDREGVRAHATLPSDPTERALTPAAHHVKVSPSGSSAASSSEDA